VEDRFVATRQFFVASGGVCYRLKKHNNKRAAIALEFCQRGVDYECMRIETIVWDGNSLSAIVAIDNRRVTCVIPRETIHTLPLYGDAVGWEIDRHKLDIFERVKIALGSKLASTDGLHATHVELACDDLWPQEPQPRHHQHSR